jgi:hypothetical protein
MMQHAQYEVHIEVEVEKEGLFSPDREAERIAGFIREAIDGDFDRVQVSVKEVQRWETK